MLFGEDRLLIFWNTRGKAIPTRPRHPERYPEHDARHWYDSEYAGWGLEETNIPESPGDGPQRKKGRRPLAGAALPGIAVRRVERDQIHVAGEALQERGPRHGPRSFRVARRGARRRSRGAH